MKIKTKYNIGDTVYVSDNGMPSKRVISGITVSVGDDGNVIITYSTPVFAGGIGGIYRCEEMFGESEIYGSPRDIIAKKQEEVQAQISELQKKIDILAGFMEKK